MNAPVPYMLKPKATKLPAGRDRTLDPPERPTDAAERGTAPSDWLFADATPGGTDPPDAALAPPATDPALRDLAPFDWARVVSNNRPLAELEVPLTLDPDIAMWPVVPVQIWPFAGAPATGRWPKGWMGLDNTSTLWVCTVGGSPGTWVQLATPNGTGWPGVNASGAGNLRATTAISDTVGYQFNDRGAGGIGLTSARSVNIDGVDAVNISSDSGLINISGATGAAINGGGGGNPVSVGQPGDHVTIPVSEIGFFNASSQSQQSGGGITTVPQLVAVLRLYGLLS